MAIGVSKYSISRVPTYFHRDIYKVEFPLHKDMSVLSIEYSKQCKQERLPYIYS